jgi:hypothetical protein
MLNIEFVRLKKMRPQVQPINPPPSCEALRVKYLTSDKYRDFKTSVQTRVDNLGFYITNGLAGDLQTAARNADPQVLYQSLIKYVRIEKTGAGYLNANHVQVFNEKGESIETSGQVTSSSVYSVSYAARNPQIGQGSFYTTYDPTGTVSKWWQLELATPSRVSKVVLTNVTTDGGTKLVLQNGDKVLVQEFPVTQSVQEFTVTVTQRTSDVISQKMNDLKTLETDVQSVLGCLQKEIIQRENISSDIYILHQQAKEKRETVTTKDINVRSSKERVAALRDPYSSTSVWESWFPLGRPLEKISVPVLWTMALIFLTVSLGLFLYIAGFHIEIGNNYVSEIGKDFSSTALKAFNAIKKATAAPVAAAAPAPVAAAAPAVVAPRGP